jgi:hypothetical protein
MAGSDPLYLMFSFDTIFPEDDRYIELTPDEYRALVAHGREFNHQDFRRSGADQTDLSRLLDDVVDARDAADLRPSEIAAARDAGTVLSCQMNI